MAGHSAAHSSSSSAVNPFLTHLSQHKQIAWKKSEQKKTRSEEHVTSLKGLEKLINKLSDEIICPNQAQNLSF